MRPARYQVQAGFTLVELLIATTLLSMILFVGSYSYSLFANRWDKELGDFSANIKDVRAMQLLQTVLDGIVPVVVVDEGKPGFYFSGKKQVLTSVSSNGLFDDEFPVVFEISAEQSGPGRMTVIYREASTQDLLLTANGQNIAFNHSITLLDDVAEWRFTYQGWESFEAKSSAKFLNQRVPAKLPSFEEYSGQVRQLVPEVIALSYRQTAAPVHLSAQLGKEPQVILSRYLGASQ